MISLPARPRQPNAAQRRVQDARVLRHRQVRAERKLLEDAAYAAFLRLRH